MGRRSTNRAPGPKLVAECTSTLYVKRLAAVGDRDFQVVTLLDGDGEGLLLHVFAVDQETFLSVRARRSIHVRNSD